MPLLHLILVGESKNNNTYFWSAAEKTTQLRLVNSAAVRHCSQNAIACFPPSDPRLAPQFSCVSHYSRHCPCQKWASSWRRWPPVLTLINLRWLTFYQGHQARKFIAGGNVCTRIQEACLTSSWCSLGRLGQPWRWPQCGATCVLASSRAPGCLLPVLTGCHFQSPKGSNEAEARVFTVRISQERCLGFGQNGSHKKSGFSNQAWHMRNTEPYPVINSVWENCNDTGKYSPYTVE